MSAWLQLAGTTAAVTGGASGIGRAVATALASVGVCVVVGDRNADGAQQTVDALTPVADREHLAVHLDVTDADSCQQLVQRAVEVSGRLDLLVNNAGINMPALLVDTEPELWERTAAVNEKGVVLCARAAARHWLDRGGGGVIVNLASESGLEGSAGQSVYAATKAAVYSLTRSWAKELGTHGIRVVGVSPGPLEETAMTGERYMQALSTARGRSVEQLRGGYDSAIALGRVGTLEEVANVVVFLASPRASYVTGTVLNVSGGKSRA